MRWYPGRPAFFFRSDQGGRSRVVGDHDGDPSQGDGRGVHHCARTYVGVDQYGSSNPTPVTRSSTPLTRAAFTMRPGAPSAICRSRPRLAGPVGRNTRGSGCVTVRRMRVSFRALRTSGSWILPGDAWQASRHPDVAWILKSCWFRRVGPNSEVRRSARIIAADRTTTPTPASPLQRLRSGSTRPKRE